MAVVRAQNEASSSTCEYSTYDVFLSFRGEDTRKNFTDHLYTALVQAGLSTFRDDDEIPRGESLKPELDKAIKRSRISIIVFSKDYVSSQWCLDELVMILKCRSTLGHVVLPVFYDVRPSEIRKQTGRTGEAFDGYMKQYEAEIDDGKKMELMKMVKGWRAALADVADLAGMELKNQADGHEAKFIKKIINVIRDKLRRTSLFVAPILIGMHSRAKNINKWLQDDSSEVSLLGICGMGGIGKTTIAKFVYDENYESFDSSCFLANVREMSEKPNGLATLQRQLLSSILNMKHEKIYNIDEGIIRIKKAISRKRVLLVLDDVDHRDQLHALYRMQDWFYSGSKIIITTRYKRLLKPHEVYDVQELDYNESLKLFSFYAFGEDRRPIEGFTELTTRLVQHCRGLPLALEVIGSSLCGRTISQWASEVEKLEAIPPKEILDKLKISYDCLQDDSDKRLFLDIACFFVGEDKGYTIKVLESTYTFADLGIQNLIELHLLKIDYDNKLMMHQLVQNMGRNIVHQESPEELGERSRLWHYEDAYSVLENETGTRKIKGLTLDMLMLKEDGDTTMEHIYEESLRTASPLTCICSFFHCFGCFTSFFGRPLGISSRISDVDLRTDAFQKMENLRLLKLNYTHLIGCYGNFPKKLVWLCWHGFPLKSVPIELPLNNLVVLDLRHSKLEEVWVGHKVLRSLKILDLSYSERLARTPNFTGIQNLERLILKGCVRLIVICESIEFLQELHLLDLKDCKNLRKLPCNMHKLGSLGKLRLSGCSTLFAAGLGISATSTAHVQGNWWLSSLKLQWVPQLIKGPEILWATFPCSLRSLSLSHCNLSDDLLPRAFNNLSLLKYLDLSHNPFHSLPDCISSLRSLQELSLYSCFSLNSILGLPSNLQALDLGRCMSLRRITFQSTPDKLDCVNTFYCFNLAEIEGVRRFIPIEKVDGRIIKNLGIDIESIKNLKMDCLPKRFFLKSYLIQGNYEFGIFSIFIPGGEIPSCFSERKKGSSMSFIVSLVPKFRIQCLNICLVYARSRHVIGCQFCIKITNKTKDLTWVYYPEHFYSWFQGRDGDMTWLSQWNFGNQLEGGDEIAVTIFTRDIGPSKAEVKECGIKVVYEEDNGEVLDDNNKTYFHWNEVVGGDLPGLQLSKGRYFIGCGCHRYFHTLNLNIMGDLPNPRMICSLRGYPALRNILGA